MAHDPQSEFLPPTPGTTAVQEYAPAEIPDSGRSRREYSEWDPRSAPGTYFLLAINLGVFAWMTLHGVSLREPTSAQLVYYGANNASLVIDHGQWYRLLTATFVHIGLFHIATNMWCLWNLGLLGEPLIGPFGLVAVYVLTGVAGNLLSLATDVYNLHRNGDAVPVLCGRRCRSFRRCLRHRRHPHHPAFKPEAPHPLDRAQASAHVRHSLRSD